VDRFQDLMVVTSQLVGDLVIQPEVTALTVKMDVEGSSMRLKMTAAGTRLLKAPVSEMALSALANTSWQETQGDGVSAGFEFRW
jgi:hypothetical protein